MGAKVSTYLAIAAGLLALGAGAWAGAGPPVSVTDATGRSVVIADASRILSIGGDVTEILYALGAADRIVAVDTTSQFPPQALKEKRSVGYMRALSSEGCLSVGASLIFASERAGPPEVVKVLKATAIPYVAIPDQHSADGILAKVRLIAKAIGAEQQGEKVAEKVATDFADLAEQGARIKTRLRALFVLGVQNGRVNVGGNDTSADAILKLAGADNVAAAVNGFRPLPDEAIVEMAPDVIIAMRRSSGTDAHDLSQLFALKGVQSTPAGANKRIVMMDGLYLLGFGPRAPAAARDLMRTLYPDLPATSETR
jgi:iron complex transport system substrate-binding protein